MTSTQKRRLRWTLALVAVAVEITLVVAWRLRRRLDAPRPSDLPELAAVLPGLRSAPRPR